MTDEEKANLLKEADVITSKELACSCNSNDCSHAYICLRSHVLMALWLLV